MFVRTIRVGEMIPWSHRCAWYDHARFQCVCFPFGIHFIAKIARRLWILSFRHRPDAWEEQCAKIRLEFVDAIGAKDDALRTALWLVDRLTPEAADDNNRSYRDILQDCGRKIREGLER